MDYDRELEVVRQARALGAVEVTVSGLTVRWAAPPAGPQPAAGATPRSPAELSAWLEAKRDETLDDEDALDRVLFPGDR